MTPVTKDSAKRHLIVDLWKDLADDLIEKLPPSEREKTYLQVLADIAARLGLDFDGIGKGGE